MTNTKAKRRDGHGGFSRLFRKHRVVSSATNTGRYQKGNEDIRGMGTDQKECPTNVTMAKLGVNQHAVGIIEYKGQGSCQENVLSILSILRAEINS